MRMDWKKLVIFLAIPLGVGGLAALLSGPMGSALENLVQPPLSPPGWVFGVVWPVLYGLMGYASYLVSQSSGEKKKAFILYGAQLAVNFLWPLLFFRFGLAGVSLLVLVALWLLVALTIRQFSRLNERAGDLLIPYILWLSFAIYLNLGIFILN